MAVSQSSCSQGALLRKKHGTRKQCFRGQQSINDPFSGSMLVFCSACTVRATTPSSQEADDGCLDFSVDSEEEALPTTRATCGVRWAERPTEEWRALTKSPE